jgi:hypothetical protein
MKLLSTLLLVVFCTAQIAAQNVLIADNTRFGEVQPPIYKDLQAAIDAAQAGDIIHVMPSSTSYGNASISKPISLFGVGLTGELGNTVWSEIGTIALEAGASDVRISGVKANGININASLNGLLIDKCLFSWMSKRSLQDREPRIELDITNIVISNNIIGGLDILQDTGDAISNLVVKNNLIGYARIFHAQILNNTITRTFGFDSYDDFYFCNVVNNILLQDFSNSRGSTFINNILPVIPLPPNAVSGNLVGVPEFEGETAHPSDGLGGLNFRLKSNSPGKTLATDGTEVGMYGGNAPFEDLGGDLPAVLSITGPVMIHAGEDVTVEIKAKAY